MPHCVFAGPRSEVSERPRLEEINEARIPRARSPHHSFPLSSTPLPGSPAQGSSQGSKQWLLGCAKWIRLYGRDLTKRPQESHVFERRPVSASMPSRSFESLQRISPAPRRRSQDPSKLPGNLDSTPRHAGNSESPLQFGRG